MKKINFVLATVFALGLFLGTHTVPASAGILGNGSSITDNMQIGEVVKVGNRQLTIATKFEKKSKKYKLVLHKDGYVLTANRGEFKKFKELKKGDLIAAYGYYKGKKWQARRIDILDPNDYLVKRLAADAAAGAYYKHER